MRLKVLFPFVLIVFGLNVSVFAKSSLVRQAESLVASQSQDEALMDDVFSRLISKLSDPSFRGQARTETVAAAKALSDYRYQEVKFDPVSTAYRLVAQKSTNVKEMSEVYSQLTSILSDTAINGTPERANAFDAIVILGDYCERIAKKQTGIALCLAY